MRLVDDHLYKKIMDSQHYSNNMSQSIHVETLGGFGSGSSQGQQGVQGLQGTPGPPGFPGSNGLDGKSGDPGQKGSAGLPGPRGPPGSPGPPGPAGIAGFSAPAGPTDPQGLTGKATPSGSYSIQNPDLKNDIISNIKPDLSNNKLETRANFTSSNENSAEKMEVDDSECKCEEMTASQTNKTNQTSPPPTKKIELPLDEDSDSDFEELREKLKRLREDDDGDKNFKQKKKKKKRLDDSEIREYMKRKVKNNTDVVKIQKKSIPHTEIERKKHSKSVLFVCTICGEKMTSLLSLKTHIKDAHPSKKITEEHKKPLVFTNEKVDFICTICNQKFKKKPSLERHLRMIHNEYFDNNVSKGEKRKNSSASPVYIKRKKINAIPQVAYKDYF